MKFIFPDEWLLITDFVLDQSGHLVSGTVARHSIDKDEVYRLPAINKSAVFKYTDISTFPTGRPVHIKYQYAKA